MLVATYDRVDMCDAVVCFFLICVGSGVSNALALIGRRAGWSHLQSSRICRVYRVRRSPLVDTETTIYLYLTYTAMCIVPTQLFASCRAIGYRSPHHNFRIHTIPRAAGIYEIQLSLNLPLSNSPQPHRKLHFQSLFHIRFSFIISIPPGKSCSNMGSPAPLVFANTDWWKCHLRSLLDMRCGSVGSRQIG